MSTVSDGPLNSGTDKPKPGRRFQTSVRTLIVLVACSAAVLWAWRNVWVSSDHVRAEARSIQERAIGALKSGRPDERMAAIVQLRLTRWWERT